MRNALKGPPETMRLWNDICDDAETKQKEWIKQLRKDGFKAAHPNDGWVDRKNNTVHLCYPQFDDGAGIGDKIMLGWPSGHLRPIRLTGVTGALLEQFTFEDV